MSTIDPFAFSTGLKAGSQFNPQPDPLQREQLKANILDRQLKAQQIAQQTQETALQASKLAIANQEAREDYNSRQALSAMVKTNPDATVNDMLANNILPAHIDKYIQMRQQSDDLRQKTIKNIDEMNSQMIDALSQTDDPAEKQKLHDQLLTQFAREGRITLDQANREIGQPPDDLSALKATKQRTDDAMALALKDATRTKDLAQARQATAEAAVKNAEIAANPQTKDDLNKQLLGIFNNNPKDPNYQAFTTRAQAAPEDPVIMGQIRKDAIDTQKDILKQVGAAKAEQSIKIATAGGEEAARQSVLAPIKAKEFQQEQDIKKQEKADTQKEQIDQQYNQMMDSYDNVKSILDSAKAGNKISNRVFQQVVVNEINKMSSIKRSNSYEMQNVAKAGGAPERIQAALVGLADGATVPPSVIKDAQLLFDNIKNNAATARDRAKATIDQYSGPAPTTPATPTQGGKDMSSLRKKYNY